MLVHFGEKCSPGERIWRSGGGVGDATVGQICTANIRQNDLAIRYDATTISLVLGGVGEKGAISAVNHLRQLIGEVRWPSGEDPIPFSCGVAEAVLRPDFDPSDIVTEVINRAEAALETAVAEGAGEVVALAAALASAAWRSKYLPSPRID